MPEWQQDRPYRCEDEAREALAGAAASLGAIAAIATLSLRWRRSGADGFLVTCPAGLGAGPASIEWARLEEPEGEAKLAELEREPEREAQDDGPAAPAAQWHLHRDLYRHLGDLGAIIRSRPVFCTALACTAAVRREGIPSFHPDVALAGGDSIRCAAPAPAGSSTLSEHVLAALQGRSACLLASGGLLVTGPTLQAAADLSAQVELLAQIYCQVLQLEGNATEELPR